MSQNMRMEEEIIFCYLIYLGMMEKILSLLLFNKERVVFLERF